MALREVILTVLARRSMTGYEIARNFDHTLSWFWRASHQQIYRELARLDIEGCVSFRVVPQRGKPDKKVYGITRRGRNELKRWIAEPTDLPDPRYDLLVKILAGSLLDRKALRAEIDRVEAATASVLAQLQILRRECTAQSLGKLNPYHQALYLALKRGLLLVKAQTAWLKEVKDYLETGRLRE
jgi:DNA-binding PadR family transcriptional regulator